MARSCASQTLELNHYSNQSWMPSNDHEQGSRVAPNCPLGES